MRRDQGWYVRAVLQHAFDDADHAAGVNACADIQAVSSRVCRVPAVLDDLIRNVPAVGPSLQGCLGQLRGRCAHYRDTGRSQV
jgi:hypothetical protein